MKTVKHFILGYDLHESPQTTNYKMKIIDPKPFWEEIKINFRRDSLIKKLEPRNLTISDAIGPALGCED